MGDVLLYASAVLGFFGVASAFVGPERLSRILPGVSWLGMIVGFGLLAAGQVDTLRAAMGTAFFAGLAVVSGGASVARRDALGGAGAIVLVASVCGLIAAPTGAVMTTGHLILIAGCLAGWTAAVSGMVAASAARGSRSLASIALASGGAAAGGVVVGFLRSSLPQSTYSIPLRTAGGEPIYWALPGVEGLAEGLRLSATLDIPSMTWIAVVALVSAAVAVIASVAKRSTVALGALVVVAACSVAALSVLHIASSEARLLGAQWYEDTTRQVLADAKAQEALVARASFTGDGEVVISRRDMAPEFFGFGVAILLVLLAAGRRFGPFRAEASDEASRLVARDLTVRAVSFGWLALLAVGLVHLGYFGVAWIGSASEWIAIGVLMMATGLVVASFDKASSAAMGALRDLAPGLSAAFFLTAIGLAYAFGTPFGLSLNAF